MCAADLCRILPQLSGGLESVHDTAWSALVLIRASLNVDENNENNIDKKKHSFSAQSVNKTAENSPWIIHGLNLFADMCLKLQFLIYFSF